MLVNPTYIAFSIFALIQIPTDFITKNLFDFCSRLGKFDLNHQFSICSIDLQLSRRKFCKKLPKTNAMGSSSGPRLSGMQKQVLSLYRGFLRAARSKSAEDRRRIESIVSEEFRRNSKEVDRKNFVYIEYLLRRGKKQLDQLKSPDIVSLSSIKVSQNPTKDS